MVRLAAFTMVAAIACAGCIIPVPIAAFMTPCSGYGEIIEFRDEHDQTIRRTAARH
jgi:hypothetical protein